VGCGVGVGGRTGDVVHLARVIASGGPSFLFLLLGFHLYSTLALQLLTPA
jgi:hypothetical protein